MSAVLEAKGLGRRYGRRWAVRDCTLAIPAGHVTGLVEPNGAGKSTLLHLAVGLIAPTTGTITVLGERPASRPAQLARVGFVAQDTPVYRRMSVANHLRAGAWLNPRWDADLACRRIEQLGLDPRQRAGSLSGGQRAQLALTLGPAEASGLRVDGALVDAIVADALAAGARLPMLSQALALTWDQRGAGRLTAEGYDRSGRVARAVEVSAEAVYAQAGLVLRGQLTADTARWRQNGKDSAQLYRGVRLAAAREAASVWATDPGRYPALGREVPGRPADGRLRRRGPIAHRPAVG